MTTPRKHQISLSDTAYYHVISRCVRRSFLCGKDAYMGKSYEHRREWVENRIRLLYTVFSIDCCSYAVMSNHYHIALKQDINMNLTFKKFKHFFHWPKRYQEPVGNKH